MCFLITSHSYTSWAELLQQQSFPEAGCCSAFCTCSSGEPDWQEEKVGLIPKRLVLSQSLKSEALRVSLTLRCMLDVHPCIKKDFVKIAAGPEPSKHGEEE